MEAVDRFLDMILVTDGGCWPWGGAITQGARRGYGQFAVGRGRRMAAHRFAYQHFIGPIPEGATLDHLCRVRHCVNPAHLEAVTIRENTLRGKGPSADHARKTRCIHGHEFTPENTRLQRQGNHYRRVCRTCAREWMRRQRAHL